MHHVAFSHLIPLLSCALAAVPAPRHLSMDSVNFHHILHWDPGPGTAPGTQYIIYTRVYGRKAKWYMNSTATSVQLKLDIDLIYYLTVQAAYDHQRSAEAKLTFIPYEDTKIGPPVVSVRGCGTCLQINISLPDPDPSSGISDMHRFYTAQFRVVCRRGTTTAVNYVTTDRRITVPNLKEGVEYCVTVDTETTLNQNTLPSAETCVFTSAVEPRQDPVYIGTLAGVLIFVGAFLGTVVFFLHYTGFLCRLRALPKPLMVLSRGYTLTPEWTTPDPISVSPDVKKQRLTLLHPEVLTDNQEEGDEDGGEEDEGNDYMDRNVRGFASGSEDATEKSGCAASEDCGDSRGCPEGEPDASDTQLDPDVTSLDGMDGAPITDPCGEMEMEMEDEQPDEASDSTAHVNLFSVTLAALSVIGDSETDETRATSTLLTLSRTDSRTEETTPLSSAEDLSQTGNTSEDTMSSGTVNHREPTEEETEDEDEDEDDFSGYMAHR